MSKPNSSHRCDPGSETGKGNLIIAVGTSNNSTFIADPTGNYENAKTHGRLWGEMMARLDAYMTSQSICRHTIGPWALILGLSIAGVTVVQPAEPVNPPSGPVQVEIPAPAQIPATDAIDLCEGLSPEQCEHIKRLSPEHRQKIERIRREGREHAKAHPLKELPRPTGILTEDELGTPFPKDNHYENGWAGTVNGKRVIVYAGSKHYDAITTAAYDLRTVRGFVIIEKGSWGQSDFYRNVIETPTAVGTLRVIVAKGNVLTLESRQGHKFSLNVETEELTSLGPK